MRALVTGGAGSIGSDLVEALLARGDEVVVFDNFSSGKRERLEALPRATTIEADLLDPQATAAAVGGVEIVYHLAANPGVRFRPAGPTGRDLEQNVRATFNVLESLRSNSAKRLVFASTSAVYGVAEKLPIAENDFFPRPISLYGATKLAAEALISSYSHLYGIQSWIFRLANIVGSKTRTRGRTVLADFIAKLREDPRRLVILGDGRQSKSYLRNSECVEGMLFAVERAREPLNVFNLGPDDAITVRRIAEMVVEAMGLHDVEFAFTGGRAGWPGDVPSFRLDVGAINRLGWKARLDSEQSVALAIEELLEGER